MTEQAFPSKTLKMRLNKLRLERCFCDAVIKVDNVEFPVHKVILCSYSPYLRDMFKSCTNESERDFKVNGVSPEIMKLMLEWIYTGSIILTQENVQDFVLGADMLRIKDLVELCFNYMEHNMCPENCIGIWRIADVVVSKSVRENAQRYILSNFEEVMVCDEFPELTVEELSGFIENDELNVKNEEIVYEAILDWAKHALIARSPYFANLLTKVRLAQFSPDFIQTRIFRYALLEDNLECRTAVANRMFSFNNSLVRPRLPGAILLAIGGRKTDGTTNVIEAYDYQANCWMNVTNYLERRRVYHSAVFLNGSVYCVGGFNRIEDDRMEHSNSMCRLDLSTHTWHEMPPMYHRRCYVTVTVLNDCIYAIGGFEGYTVLSSAEVYNPETNQWSLIAPMHEKRSDANCAALNCRIYVCGGYNGTEVLQTAECYNPSTNQWTMIAHMTTRRRGVGVIAFANHIFAVGGTNGKVTLSSVEAYYPRTNSWRPVASMNIPRNNLGIEVVDDRIFAVGGYRGFNPKCSVEYYVNNTWIEAPDMNIIRKFVNCCVISGLTNMAEFTVPRDALALQDVDNQVNLQH